MIEKDQFALCLTHDVDRPYKARLAPLYALKNRELSHLRALRPSARPYWQFETIQNLEAELDVRSTFFFLQEKRLFGEKPVRAWVRPENWKLYAGRYDIESDEITAVIRTLDRDGWEVGLHGSFDSYADPDRLREEKELLEDVVGHEVTGIRQHYLNLDRPETWQTHRELGLAYDSSLGSTEEYGFIHGYGVLEPLDGLTVFPITVMEVALMRNCDNTTEAKAEIDALLAEANSENAIMTALWHPRFFNTEEFPGYTEVYTHMIRKAKEMNAFVGTCADVYDRFVQ